MRSSSILKLRMAKDSQKYWQNELDCSKFYYASTVKPH